MSLYQEKAKIYHQVKVLRYVNTVLSLFLFVILIVYFITKTRAPKKLVEQQQQQLQKMQHELAQQQQQLEKNTKEYLFFLENPDEYMEIKARELYQYKKNDNEKIYMKKNSHL